MLRLLSGILPSQCQPVWTIQFHFFPVKPTSLAWRSECQLTEIILSLLIPGLSTERNKGLFDGSLRPTFFVLRFVHVAALTSTMQHSSAETRRSKDRPALIIVSGLNTNTNKASQPRSNPTPSNTKERKKRRKRERKDKIKFRITVAFEVATCFQSFTPSRTVR